MYKYKIVEGKDKNGDPIIEKSNVKVEFTMNEMDLSRQRAVKMLEEVKGNLILREAEKVNVETNHPHVIDDSKNEDLVFRAQKIAFYVDKLRDIKLYQDKIKDLEEAIAEHDSEVEEIKKQLEI